MNKTAAGIRLFFWKPIGHPLESSGQAGSCVFLIFLFKNQALLLYKLTLNMTMHPVMTSIYVNMHRGLDKERHMNLGSLTNLDFHLSNLLAPSTFNRSPCHTD